MINCNDFATYVTNTIIITDCEAIQLTCFKACKISLATHNIRLNYVAFTSRRQLVLMQCVSVVGNCPIKTHHVFYNNVFD